MKDAEYGYITDVPGVAGGHKTDVENGTGATVLIFEKGARGGVDLLGLASGSRELPVLDPTHVTPECHGLCLAGGSAFGLAAADGAMKWMSEKNIGYFARVAVVPIVPAAIIFDLSFKNHEVRPDLSFGYEACAAASSAPLEMGSVGAGTGATVGKILGIDNATKSGIGTASIKTPDGVTIGAVAVVNNLGDVLDRDTGKIIAGTRDPETGEFADTSKILAAMKSLEEPPLGENTNLVAVATDAYLDKTGAKKLARMASAGMARTLAPSMTTFDGDVIFAFSTGDLRSDVNRLGVLASEVVAVAINRAVTEADGLGVLPAIKDLSR